MKGTGYATEIEAFRVGLWGGGMLCGGKQSGKSLWKAETYAET